MEACDALKTINGNSQVIYFCDLLNGEVIPNASGTVPDEFVHFVKRLWSTNDIVD